ncbi:MAG: ornithine carbamoyltransferase [Nitrososphaeria archaeon]|nr:ornithine carbamoyltransferase [Nitrosopumilaceae archaeon]NIP10376.1 ornithine carbamoyltransferase [Nitrosopumilaceae archaeon]NIP91103.1 ornithine carbamoyltransferase [Nitrososphaeria archaeon]NIS95055.1 ornithine carbamoyltransferase [Nitrosopumilaceae archaeon]
MKLKTKNLLTLGELSQKEFSQLIDYSIKLKKELKKGQNKPLLKNKTLTMIFQKPSTRTRVSFEIGMFQLGGGAINLSSNDMQLSRGESVEDTAKTLSRYTDCIMARVYDHKLLENLAEHSSIPVINGLSDAFHPCQILADFMTIKEKKKRLKGLKLAWVGDGNNVCNSMIYGCALSQMTMSIATPKGFEPNSKVVKEGKSATQIELTSDPQKAIKNADIVVTDTFSSIHNTDPKRTKKFLPKYQVNSKLMKLAKKDAIFMHCLPAKRGSEVTSSVIDGPQSVVWDEAENRLHSQKALLVFLINA